MTWIQGAITAGVFGASLILAPGPTAQARELAQEQAQARDQDHTGKKVGQQLDELGQTIKRGLKNTEDAIREQFAKTRQFVHDMDLAARVYGRLHWDKRLHGSELDLDVKDEVATLSGTVPDAKARAKAVELARDTVGIREVKDQLTIAHSQSTSAEPAPSAANPPR